MNADETMNKPTLLESLPFEGTVNAIIVKRVESEKFPGGQVIVIYFNSIGGRNKPECVWEGQPPEKMGQYEKQLLASVKANFQDYPVVIAAVPPHAATLFAFGSPLLKQSEVNIYRLAGLNVPDMSAQPASGQGPQLIGCPLDEAVIHNEYLLWQGIPKDAASPLDLYAQKPRNPQTITASMTAPNKMFNLLSK